MARKPRTNSEALEHWASFVHGTEVGPYIEVNSMLLRGDTIYHYGSHYPMAHIIRKVSAKKRRANPRADIAGKVECVLVNSTPWHGSSGWGWSTDSTVSSLHEILNRTGAPVYRVALSGNGNRRMLVEHDENDPMPEVPNMRDVKVPPLKNPPTDPGPEPIKDQHGCIAGHYEVFEAQEQTHIFSDIQLAAQDQAYTIKSDYRTDMPRAGDFMCLSGTGRYPVVRRAHMRGIVWGENDYGYNSPEKSEAERENPRVRFEYKQCPHCRAHQIAHRNWHARMYGGWDAHYNKIKWGWRTYCEQIEEYGSVEEWRDERRRHVALVKQQRQALAEWMDRNSMSFDALAQVQVGNVQILKGLVFDQDRIERKVFEQRIRYWANEHKRRQRALREKRKREEQAERERQARIAEMRARMEAGEMVDDTAIEWIAERNVAVEKGYATLYKRVHDHDGKLVSRSGTSEFEYKIGEWAIAEDYQPTNECGHGLHFAESPERTDFHYGNTIIECIVPIASIINMNYKVKAERAFVTRIINQEQ